jgi:hypothetical protein
MNRIALWILAQILLSFSAQAVPPVLNYAGQVTVNGEAFDGNGLFKFALVNTDGTTTYWSNDGTSVDGSEPQASVAIPVSGGLYAVLLGNTAQQGMGAINPQAFAQHSDAKLRVWFSDGVNGFQQLSPDRPFASVPYAFTAGTAQTAGSAPIANGTVNLDMLSQDVKTQINATIGLERLSSEIISKLEQNATITNGSVTGSKMADGAITTDKLNEQILKYLKPEITSEPQAQTVYGDSNVSFSVTAEGKYLTYQWKNDGVDLTGETNATLNITDANATLHDGNYSVVVSNDFGSVESELIEIRVSIWSPSTINHVELWLDASDVSTITQDGIGKVSIWADKSGGNRNLSQPGIDSIKPIFNENEILFNGTQYLFNNSPFMYNNGSIEIFIVASGDSQDDKRFISEASSSDNDPIYAFQTTSQSPTNRLAVFFRNDQYTAMMSHSPILNDVAMDGSFKILTWKDTGSSISARVNGGTTGTINYSRSGSMTTNLFCIGGILRSSFVNGFSGSIKEIIISSPMSNVDSQKIEGYLANKWGLKANLPADHPYKNNAP